MRIAAERDDAGTFSPCLTQNERLKSSINASLETPSPVITQDSLTDPRVPEALISVLLEFPHRRFHPETEQHEREPDQKSTTL